MPTEQGGREWESGHEQKLTGIQRLVARKNHALAQTRLRAEVHRGSIILDHMDSGVNQKKSTRSIMFLYKHEWNIFIYIYSSFIHIPKSEWNNAVVTTPINRVLGFSQSCLVSKNETPMSSIMLSLDLIKLSSHNLLKHRICKASSLVTALSKLKIQPQSPSYFAVPRQALACPRA